jgi:hypothetical protein
MSRLGRRYASALGGLVLLAGLVSGCGGSDNSAAPPSPAPAVSAGAITATACASVKQIKQSVADLKTAVADGNLDAGKAAWASFTAAVSDLGAAAKETGASAAQSLDTLLEPLTSNFAELDTLAKLGAVVSALQLLGPNVDNAITQAQAKLPCPS